MSKLTDQQRRTLDFIRDFIKANGYAPKITEIAKGLGIRSKSASHRYVQALAKANYITIQPMKSRGIQLNDYATAPLPAKHIPLAGAIAAGQPIEAIPDQAHLDLSAWTDNDVFALKVRGDSMIEAGIQDGDIVICRPETNVHPHQIAVVLVDNLEATLKYCEHKDGQVTLIPANAELKPQTYTAKRVQVQGVVVSQLRHYDP